MDRVELINKIVEEINRIFGPSGFEGNSVEYAWLNEHYGVSEEADVRWQDVCVYQHDGFDGLFDEPYEEDELAVLKFLEDEQAVVAFLNQLLTRYRSGSIVYAKSMTTTTTAIDVKASLLGHCKQIGIEAIEAHLSEPRSAPTIRLDYQAFQAALMAEKPKAVFWQESLFDAESWLISEMEDQGWNEDDDEDGELPTLEQVRRQLAPHLEVVKDQESRPYFLMCYYSADGICRVMSFISPWYSALSTVVEDMFKAHSAILERAQDQSQARSKGLLDALIVEIAARDDFRALKGLPKRAALLKCKRAANTP